MPKKEDSLVVGLFFGKKDNPLLFHFFQSVSSEEFLIVTKAALKHSLKNELFKIHIYADITGLLDLDLNQKPIEEQAQRNIKFYKSEGFLYDWLSSMNKIIRAREIKKILILQLTQCLDILKNGEKKEEKKEEPKQSNIPPSPPYYILVQQPHGISDFPYPPAPSYNQGVYPYGIPSNYQVTQQEGLSESPNRDNSYDNIETDSQTSSLLKKFKNNSLSQMGRRRNSNE